jgi:hypothetical protein
VSDPKRRPNWAALASAPEVAPKQAVAAEDTPEAPKVRRTAKRTLARPVLRAGTYRLPEDAHALIAAEVEAAAERGDRVSQQDAVTYALRQTYGKKHADRAERIMREAREG